MPVPILDAASLPAAVRHGRIFETFDALAVGASFVLANDHYPLPLLYQFQRERPNQFDWSVLEVGARFRVAIRKRDASVPRGVHEYLTWDHARLDALLDETVARFREASVDDARARFAEFSRGLERHIVAEEEVVFPAFDAAGYGGGPTSVMLVEHQEIRRAMAAIAAALDRNEAPAFDEAIRRLVSVLKEHNLKEEHVLYPAVDQMLSPSESAALVEKVQALPP